MFKLPVQPVGADVVFRSTASVYAVCAYCKTAAVRQDLNLADYGVVADVHLNATPLQIGSRGRYGKQSFELIGRLRVGWENGFWNEWLALFEDGKSGWLAESQGFYAMNFEKSDEEPPPPATDLKPGQVIRLGVEVRYEVDDIKTVTCLGSEGELPFMALAGRKAISVDLSAPNGLFASIEYAGPEIRVFYGEYVDFNDFSFSFLRELDGW